MPRAAAFIRGTGLEEPADAASAVACDFTRVCGAVVLPARSCSPG